MKKPRVFITGLSTLTAAGDTLQATWCALQQGQSAIGPIEQWPLQSWPHRLGGEIKSFKAARMLPDKKLAKVVSRQDVLGINAAMQAIEHSQIIAYRQQLTDATQFNDETGVYVGSPGNKYCQQYDFLTLLAKTNGALQPFAEQLFSEVHPTWLLRILPNNVLAYTGIHYGFKGANHNIANHAVSGMQAVMEAYHAIISGQIERAVVVAYDTGIEPEALFYYDQLGVVSPDGIKPFDQKHNGTILAEGAAALVLESEQSVQARDALCFAEVLGGGSNSEADGLFTLDNTGQPLQQLIQQTLLQTHVPAAQLQAVVAHGNGNPCSDDSEAQAISQLLAHKPQVSAFKWAMGHTLAASGLIDVALAAHALHQQYLPTIATLTTPSPQSDSLNLVTTPALLPPDAHALVINRGFGSMNACVVLKGCHELH